MHHYQKLFGNFWKVRKITRFLQDHESCRSYLFSLWINLEVCMSWCMSTSSYSQYSDNILRLGFSTNLTIQDQKTIKWITGKKGCCSSHFIFFPDYRTCLLPWQTSIWRPCGSQRTSHSRCSSSRQRMMNEQERRCWPAIYCPSSLPQALVSITLLMQCFCYCPSLGIYKTFESFQMCDIYNKSSGCVVCPI